MGIVRMRAAVVALWIVGLAGCGWLPTRDNERAGDPEAPTRDTPETGADTGGVEHDDLSTALEHLQRGRYGEAERLLSALQSEDRYPETVALMLEQLNAPIDELVPGPYREIRVESGDSLSLIAERELGNPLLFLSLARLNGIEIPGRIVAGTSLRVPGREAGIVSGAADIDEVEGTAGPGSEGGAGADPGRESVGEDPPEPADAVDLHRKAAELTSRGELIAAYRKANEALEADPEFVPAQSLSATLRAQITEELHDKAIRAWRDRNVDLAIRTWENLLEVVPEFEPAQVYLARARELRARLDRP